MNDEDSAMKSRQVVILDPQTRWRSEFEDMGTDLRRILGDTALRIDHIGSTSVPGLGAKDIIDIQVTVADLGRMTEFVTRMKKAGFLQRGDVHRDNFVGLPDGTSIELEKKYFREAEGDRRRHMHIRQEGRFNQRYALLFRDYLRQHPEVAQEYAALKDKLAHQFQHNRPSYMKGKTPFIDQVVTLARAEYAYLKERSLNTH